MPHDTIPARLFERATRSPDQPAYFVKERGLWRGTNWASYAERVHGAARALAAEGVQRQECVALIGGNRPEWSTLMIAAAALGARGVGLYTTSSLREMLAILKETGATIALVDRPALLERVLALRDALPRLRRVVTTDERTLVEDPFVISFARLLELGRSIEARAVDERLASVRADDVATVVYTSGAEGAPQGVMLSHRNLTWTADTVAKLFDLSSVDATLSYLPLSHVSEQLFTVHGPICAGSTVYYAESVRDAPRNLREVQPTVLFGVPRIWEKLAAGAEARLRNASGARARIVSWAREVGARVVRERCAGKDLTLELAAQYELANTLVLDQLRSALGLGRARVCLSGAAPIGEETLRFFASIGIQLLEIYGQTESTGPITMNQPRRTRFGSAGPKLPGMVLELSSEGELFARGPNVFVGYVAGGSSRMLVDGALATGDLATVDSEGFVYIRGRKREILVTAGGKNIAPTPIESALQRNELIRDAVVVGDRQRFLAALVTIDEDAAHELGLTGVLHENEVVRERIARHINTVNVELGSVQQIRRYSILPRPLSVDMGELTPTLKLRRDRIEELWAKEIAALYAEGLEVVDLGVPS